MERKIGEIFEFGGEWYQCIEDTECISCINCCFYNGGHKLCTDESMGVCVSEYRSDKKSMCFKKLEKVGEQFLYKGKQVQSYIRATNELICNWNNNLLLLEHGDSDIIDIEIKENKEDMEENKLNLKSFDIQKAREGKPVCTRDGRKARIVCFNRVDADNKCNIVALIERDGEEIVRFYDELGNQGGNNLNMDNYDLMMLSKKKEGW